VRVLLQSRAGQIVVINSVQGKFGMGCRTSYSASKHAMTG
jgi:NAD(P)-dependent dehydrogenase (short-subunit alcohol dehydrogenase family)